MKYLILLMAVMLIALIPASPAMAQDPLDVAIGISGDDVNVDIDIEGNQVNVSVDGVDFKGVLNRVEGLGSYSGGAINTNDWYIYWNKEIGPYAQVLAAHDNLLGLLTDAQAKLIVSKELNDKQLGLLQSTLESLKGQFVTAIAASKLEDARIMHQLVYGAETHIAINAASIDRQSQSLSNQSARLDNLEAQLHSLQQYSDAYAVWAEGELSAAYEYINMLRLGWLILCGLVGVAIVVAAVYIVNLYRRL